MAGAAWKPSCQFGLLTYFIVFSHISLATSVSLDLTELRNKVSKIKVNPRGNLWATGHFMGKKSVVDSSLLESPSEQAISALQASLHHEANAQDLREFIVEEMLKVAVEDPLQDALEKSYFNEPEVSLLMMILENYIQSSRK